MIQRLREYGSALAWRQLMLAACGLVLLTISVAGMLYRLLPPLEDVRYRQFEPSLEMADRNGKLLNVLLNQDDHWCLVRDLSQINSLMVQATIAAEDQRFYTHAGVDPIAVVRAAAQDLYHGKVVSGASTISMQVVKLTEGRSRKLSGKVGQMVQALRLEKAFSKNEILYQYLNRAPYGANLIGVEAAALRFFGKSAGDLTLSEAALLAGLPKAPGLLHPVHYPAAARQRRDYVLKRMHAEGFISLAQYQAATEKPVMVQWHDFPKQAPHLAVALNAKKPVPDKTTLTTTLDKALQARFEKQVKKYLRRFDHEITNAAVMVVDVESGEVLVRLGSADFFHTPGGGQVDLCKTPRSPGSTLKPFVYGLAFEQNKLYPSETLLDDTLDFGSYSPGNFDDQFNGLVTAGDALKYSLNVPAVMTLQRVGVAPFAGVLKQLGITLDHPADHYGLGLALGNCEVSLEQLAAAYTALAYEGLYRPLNTLKAEKPLPSERIFARGTALMLYAMLEQPFPYELNHTMIRAQGNSPRVCWKTGTSSGLHDAWTIAFNRQYCVAVWVGNNDGRGSHRIVGSKAALPLAAALFRQLPVTTAPVWPAPENTLHRVKVCAVSGLPATAWCTQTKMATWSKDLYVHRRCAVHWPGEDRVLTCWPGSALHWDLAQVKGEALLATAGLETNAAALTIRSPANQGEYVVTGKPDLDKIPLQVTVQGTGPLFWYYDDQFLGVTHNDAPRYLPLAPGPHKVSCMDSRGQIDSVHFDVMSLKATALPGTT